MKAAVDVHYTGEKAFASCVVFQAWRDSEPTKVMRVTLPAAKAYRAGKFYERELPCLLAVLKEAGQNFETIIIDGYVHLRGEQRKGLGAHLYDSLPYSAAVIGVAKNPLMIADRFVSIVRGRSKRPLFISAIGSSLDDAAQSVLEMHGPFRIPTLLKLTDQNARSGL